MNNPNNTNKVSGKKVILFVLLAIIVFAAGMGGTILVLRQISNGKEQGGEMTEATSQQVVSEEATDVSSESTVEATTGTTTEITTEQPTEKEKQMYTVNVEKTQDNDRNVAYVYIDGDDYITLKKNVENDVKNIVADMPGANEVGGIGSEAEIYRQDEKIFSMVYTMDGFEWGKTYGLTYNADTGEKIRFTELGVDEEDLKALLYDKLKSFYYDRGFTYNPEFDEGFTDDEIDITSKTHAEKACDVLFTNDEDNHVEYTVSSKADGTEYGFYEDIVWWMTDDGIEVSWSSDAPENLVLQISTVVSITFDELDKIDSYYVN